MAVLAGATGARVSRKRSGAPKTIAGVPILDYHLAYGGDGVLGELEAEAEQEWNILVEPGTSDALLQRMCKANPNGCNLVGQPTGGVPFLEMRGTEVVLERVLSIAKGFVKFVVPDHEIFMIPEMPSEVGVQAATWGLNRIGADQRINQGAGVSVFVQDTGVRTTHTQFSGRAFSAMDMSSGSQVVCNGALNCATDAQGHGTHCAGSAAGSTYGVAPGAQVRAIKTLSDQGSGALSWQYAGVNFAAASSIRPAVLSMSLGGAGADPGFTPVIDAAVGAGVVVVVAGGNENSDACGFSPAYVPSAVTVGATDSNDARSYFSNYGQCTDIWAPGSSVLSAGIASDSASATYSGTSMACPHVSGAAALQLAANPSLSPSGVLSNLLTAAATNVISDLRPGDTNALLYVGAGGAPPAPTVAPTTPAPPGAGCPAATSTGPDSDGDCRCNSGLVCYENGSRGCTFSYTATWGFKSTIYFLPSCGGCACTR